MTSWSPAYRGKNFLFDGDCVIDAPPAPRRSPEGKLKNRRNGRRPRGDGARSMYEIGPFRLDPQAQVLLHGGEPVALGPRAVQVLTTLVEHAHRHVGKESLINAAWPGRIVEESNLNVQVSAIRRALGRAPGGAAWVETLPR